MSKLPSDITKLIHNKQLEIDQKFKANLKANLFKEESSLMAKQVKKSKIDFNSKSWQNFFKKLNTASGLSLIALLIVVGGASALVGSNSAKRNSEKQTEIPTNLDGVMPVSDIKAKALTDVPSGKIIGIELENEQGKLVYKVRFSDGSYRLYDAKTGEAITGSQVEKDSSVPSDFVAGIDLATARTIAQNERPGKIINKIELETENGIVIYSVRFTDGGRVDINAKDGKVVSVRSAEGTSTSPTTTQSSDDDKNDDSNSSSSGSDDSSSHDTNDDSSGSSTSGSSNTDSEDHSGSNSGSSNSGSNSGSGSGSDSNKEDKSGHN